MAGDVSFLRPKPELVPFVSGIITASLSGRYTDVRRKTESAY